jgi:hypothetical protein
MDKRIKAFVELVRKECLSLNVEFRITKTKQVDNGDHCLCSGYFEDDSGGSRARLVVAGKHPNWFETLVHEFNHLRQWKEHDPIWLNEHIHFWAWVSGETPKLSHRNVVMSVRRLRNLELDCEKRSVRMIRKYKLPIDIEHYIKGANAYVKFYTLLGKTGAWCTKSTYRTKKIMRYMPTRFMPERWYRTLDKQFVADVFEHCYSASKRRKALAQLIAA